MRRRDVSDACGLALPQVPVQDGLLRLVMDRLESHVDPASELFRTNAERMNALVRELRERTAVARVAAASDVLTGCGTNEDLVGSVIAEIKSRQGTHKPQCLKL